MIMGSTTLIKRGTASQLIEASVSLDMIRNSRINIPVIDENIDVSNIDPHVAVFVNRMVPVRNINSEAITVYGSS